MSSTRKGKIVKVGGSLWITLPAPWLRYYGLGKGDVVELVYDGEVRVKPPRGQLKAEIQEALAEIGPDEGEGGSP